MLLVAGVPPNRPPLVAGFAPPNIFPAPLDGVPEPPLPPLAGAPNVNDMIVASSEGRKERAPVEKD